MVPAAVGRPAASSCRIASSYHCNLVGACGYGLVAAVEPAEWEYRLVAACDGGILSLSAELAWLLIELPDPSHSAEPSLPAWIACLAPVPSHQVLL